MDDFWVVWDEVAYEYVSPDGYYRTEEAAVSAAEILANKKFTGWYAPVPEPSFEEGLPKWNQHDGWVYVTKEVFSG